MTRDEFAALPVRIALGIIYDLARAKLEPMQTPQLPRSPKYDGRLSRQGGGFVWYSEMALEDLEYWWKKNTEGAAAGGQYAERNAKAALSLEKWVDWRRLFPTQQWRGTRGEDKATGAPPSRDPRVHQWDDKPRSGGGQSRSGGGSRSEPPPAREDDDFDL